jgi:carboxymethylenebutenolidase
MNMAALRREPSARQTWKEPSVSTESTSADNPRQNVTFPSNGHEAHGYLARPPSGKGPGVVVIQEWWGLTDHIVDVCDRLAAEGFVALAPDLFGGKTTHDSGEANALMTALPVEQAARDLSGAVDFLLGHPAVTSQKVGAVGFCMGGGFVLLLAAQQGDKIGAAVPFYGVGPAVPDKYSDITAAVQGHYGTQDAFYPVEGARAQEEQIRREAGVDVEFFYYDAGHAFHNDADLLGTYDEGAAKLAWQRTVEFLKTHLI